MPVFIRLMVITCTLFTYHLQLIAGDTFMISGVNNSPEITVVINTTQLIDFKNDFQQNAKSILSLHLVRNGIVEPLPVAGKYKLIDSQLSYTPLYPLGQGLDFEIWYTAGGDTTTQRYHTTEPGRVNLIATTARIYPAADTVPVNILSFHIRFSQPMADDRKAYTYVNLYTEDGKQLERVWRQRSYWLDSNKLLLLMIHPGRVKSGIHYIGAVFENGKSYTLQLENGLKDKNGNKIQISIAKTFIVSGEDKESPYIKEVVVNRRSKNEVSVLFSESMDMGTITEGVKVFDDQGSNIPCYIRGVMNDRRFIITPYNKWRAGRYTIRIYKNVSDLAANRLTRRFEIKNIMEKENEAEFVSRSFKIR